MSPRAICGPLNPFLQPLSKIKNDTNLDCQKNFFLILKRKDLHKTVYFLIITLFWFPLHLITNGEFYSKAHPCTLAK